jgi:hypothetical protein
MLPVAQAFRNCDPDVTQFPARTTPSNEAEGFGSDVIHTTFPRRPSRFRTLISDQRRRRAHGNCHGRHGGTCHALEQSCHIDDDAFHAFDVLFQSRPMLASTWLASAPFHLPFHSPLRILCLPMVVTADSLHNTVRPQGHAYEGCLIRSYLPLQFCGWFQITLGTWGLGLEFVLTAVFLPRRFSCLWCDREGKAC